MRNEDLTYADGEKEFSDALFERLDLRDKAVTSREFHSCVFKGCDLTRASLVRSRFTDCRFESCNLSLAKLPGSSFSSVVFRSSKLAGVNWTEAAWPRIKLPGQLSFEDCVLSDAVFLGLYLRGASFLNCLAKGADFREADLSGAALRGTDFSGALFGGTDLSGADLSLARNYAIRPDDNKLKNAVFSMPEAMALLYCMDIKLQ
ncbi:MAG: hypothetical protein A2X31_13565 [Elusimicrobia bacterium GWB2_63_22]|nr:MAG: hypothetical protein A2X31_13565 [Elusimicrobia bacterium GWB2_63_22]